MHYSLILQPCSKKTLEKASNKELLAYSSTSWTAESPISTACLSCFGVTMATSCRQARGAWTQQAAEVEAVVLAKQLASHCQSLIQGMQLDLALPELKIFFCSLTCDLVTGRPLALKLGLSRRNRQVQLQDGQLRLCKVLPHKNLAECLTKNLSTASFHRLLPKLMVHTRAVKAQALLTRLGGENQASFCSSSFFIGMVALTPPMALTRASSTASLQLRSFTGETFYESASEKDRPRNQLSVPDSLQISFASLTRHSLSKPLCQKSFDSLTGYSLSTQLCQHSLQSLTDDKLELGSPESESFSDQLCTVSFHIFRKDFCRTGFHSFSDQLCTVSFHIFRKDFCKTGFHSFSNQLCTVSFHIFRKDFCRTGFHSFSDQLCTASELPYLSKRFLQESFHRFSDQLCPESFEHWISQPQLDLVTSLSLQKLIKNSFRLTYAQLSFHKFSAKNLESLTDQLCRNPSESLTDDKLELGDQLRQSSFQRFSFQLSRRSLQELILQLDLVSLSLASELGSRTYSRQLQTIHSESSSFEQRAFTSAALLGSTKLGHKQSRSSCTRSSTSASPTSPSKTTTSSLQTTLCAILLFTFLFTNSFINNIFLNISFWKNDVEANNQMCKTAWESASNKQFQDNNLLSNRALATQFWQNELGMNLAERAAWNIQLFNPNRDNITLELAEDQLENKKHKQNKKNNTASQQLGPQQLRQVHLQLPQLSRQHADTAISRQLSKKPLSSCSRSSRSTFHNKAA